MLTGETLLQVLTKYSGLEMCKENGALVTWNSTQNCFHDSTQDSQTLDYVFYKDWSKNYATYDTKTRSYSP